MSSFSPVRMFALVVAAGVLVSACGGGDQGVATQNGRSEPAAMSEPAEDEAFHETSSCDDEAGDVTSRSKGRNLGQRADDLTSVQLEVTDEELTATFETSAPLPKKPAPGGELWAVNIYEEGAREPLIWLTAQATRGAARREGYIGDFNKKKEIFTKNRRIGDIQISDAGIVLTVAIADSPELPARIAWYAAVVTYSDGGLGGFERYLDVCPGPKDYVLSPGQVRMLPTLQMPASS